MKRIVAIIGMVAITGMVNAQNYTDALRYSERFNQGDARYTSMGGAMSAVGLNHSAISDNPAGIGVFTNGSGELTFANGFNSTNSTFLGESLRANNASFRINNFAVLGSWELPNNDLNAKYLNFSFSINKVNDFNDKISLDAYNDRSSFTDDFLINAEKGNLNYGYVGDALDAEIIYFDSLNNDYVSDFYKYSSIGQKIRGPYGTHQSYTSTQTGKMYNYSYGVGTNFDDKVYLGGSLNLSTLSYSITEDYSENDENNLNPTFNSLSLHNSMDVTGKGFNLKLGLIGRPIENVRLAVAYHTPIFWSISEDYNSSVSGQFVDDTLVYNTHSGGQNYTNDYHLYSPGRVVAGVAYTIKKTLMLTADYEYCAYPNAVLSNSSYSYNSQNKGIQNNLRKSNAVKMGAEFKVGPLSLRAGTALYQSPDNYFKADYGLYKAVYSGGFGIKNQNFYMDLAFSSAKTLGYKVLYQVDEKNYEIADTKSFSNQLLLTVGLKY